MRIQQYYSQVIARSRRGGPTYEEAARDLSAATRSRVSTYIAI